MYESTVCDQQVTYHPDDLKPCANGATACTLRQGAKAYAVYYSTLDAGVIEHEKEHVCGMRHREPWVSVSGISCTEVTEAGLTLWKRGDVMCRFNAGAPVRVTEARLLATIETSAGWDRLPPATELLADLGAAPQSVAADPASPVPRQAGTWRRGDTPRLQLDAAWNVAYGEPARQRGDFIPGADYNVRHFHVLQWHRRAVQPPLLEPRSLWIAKSSIGA